MNRIALLLSVALMIPATSLADTATSKKPTQPAVDTLIAKAKATGKPLVLDFYAVWCKPCKKFDKEVLPRKDVRAALAGVIFQKYDAEKGNGMKAAKRYGVSAYPTFLIVDGKGKARNRKKGGIPAARFLAFVGQGKVDVLDAWGVQRLLAAKGSDPNTLLSVARWYRGQGQWKQSDAIYQRAVRADPGDGKGVASVAAWECMQLQRYHKARAWIVKSNAGFVARFPGSAKAMTAFGRIALALSPSRRNALASSVLHGMMNDATRLNGAVYSFLAVGAFDAALAAAKQQVALLPKDANPYDSLAEAHHYRGEQALAIATSKKAISMSKPAMVGEFKRNLARFQAPGKKPVRGVTQATYRAKQFLAKLPGVDPSAQNVTRPRRTGTARSGMDFFRTVRTTFSQAGKACAKRAGKLPEVYVRVEFADITTSKAKKVVVLEPGASWRLKRCLVKQLGKVAWKTRPAFYKTRYTSRVRFPKKSAKSKKPKNKLKLKKLKRK